MGLTLRCSVSRLGHREDHGLAGGSGSRCSRHLLHGGPLERGRPWVRFDWLVLGLFGVGLGDWVEGNEKRRRQEVAGAGPAT